MEQLNEENKLAAQETFAQILLNNTGEGVFIGGKNIKLMNRFS